MNELTHAVVLLIGVALKITDPADPRVAAELRALLVTLHERSEAAYAYQDTVRGQKALERFPETTPDLTSRTLDDHA